jgi:hypothetical protein
MANCYISKKTLTEFDNIIQTYKIRMLKDIFKTYDIKSKMNETEFINMFLERKEQIIKRSENIDYDKCMARIWSKKYGFYQCRNNQKNCTFCEVHSKKLNYGRIDREIKME